MQFDWDRLRKIYREHTAGILPDRKQLKQGIEIDDQSETTFQYTESNPGDEAGWLHWNENTRALGAWSQAVPAIITPENNLIPILNKTLATDTSFASKTASSLAASDVTKYRLAEEVEAGTPGILVQCLNQDEHQQIFFPLGGGAILVDWASGGNTSTKIYGTLIDGTKDVGNVGTTKDIWRVDTNQVYNITTAGWRYDNTKKGPLAFTNNAIPTPGAGETLYQPELIWDSVSSSWKWYIVVTDGTGIISDNTNIIDGSTNIYGALLGGGADPANKGSMKEVFWIESNFPYITTTAKFRYDATKKGALDFDSGAIPTPGAGEILIQSKAYWNSSSTKWEWYATAETGAASRSYCRVRWDFNIEGNDLSEGEILSYNTTTLEWDAQTPVEKIWIDWKQSAAVKFETAGTNTIFECVLVKSDVVRSNVTRDLYRLVQCVDDQGYPITHLEKTNFGTNKLAGYILSDSLFNFPWLQPTVSRIKTKIGVSEVPNKMQCRIPKEWDTTIQNWKFVEISDISRSIPFYFRPMRPIMEDPTNNIYKSFYVENNGSTTIATYKRI